MKRIKYQVISVQVLILLTDRVCRNAQTRQLSHPLPVLRAREVDDWSKGQEYKNLLKRGTKINFVETA